MALFNIEQGREYFAKILFVLYILCKDVIFVQTSPGTAMRRKRAVTGRTGYVRSFTPGDVHRSGRTTSVIVKGNQADVTEGSQLVGHRMGKEVGIMGMRGLERAKKL